MITINTNKLIRLALIAVIAILAIGISPGSAEKLTFQPLPSPALDPYSDMGTAFTYQGRLMSGGNPANGSYDFTFSLYDDGGPAGIVLSTLPPVTLTVTNGLFMTDLDFGAKWFLGYERWLEIAVEPSGSPGDPTILSPRQRINPAPYATFARTIYRKTMVVKPSIPSDPVLNGQMLINTLGAITDASPANPYLVKVEPGTYDLGEASLQLKQYVDLEGSGEGVTFIIGDGQDVSSSALVIGASNVEIRSLTIESMGYRSPEHWFGNAVGVRVPQDTSLKLTHVTVSAHDGSEESIGIVVQGGYVYPPEGDPYYVPAQLFLDSVIVDAYIEDGFRGMPQAVSPRTTGILNSNMSTTTMTTSHIYSTNGEDARGIDNYRGHSFIYDSEIVLKGMNFNIYSGIRNYFRESGLYMRDSEVVVAPDNGMVSSYANGIENNDAGIVQLFDSKVTVASTNTIAVGIRGGGEAPALLALNNVKVETFGSNPSNIGIHYGDAPVFIRDSHVYAHDGDLAIGIFFQDIGAADHTVTQTIIKADGATPSGETDPTLNSNIGVKIWSDGWFKFIRDTIEVPGQFEDQGVTGGVGILNDGGGIQFENSTINDAVMPAYMGIVHVFYGANTLTVNSSELYTCSNGMCVSVIGIPIAPPTPLPPILIGSTLLWGGPVLPPAGGPPPWFVQCAFVYDELWTTFAGPVCP